MIRLDTKNMLLCTTNVVFIAMDIPRSGKTFRIVKTVKKNNVFTSVFANNQLNHLRIMRVHLKTTFVVDIFECIQSI